MQQRWAGGRAQVTVCRLLVPHEKVPIWDRVVIKSLSQRRDLYTSLDGTEGSDEFEALITNEVDIPSQESIERLVDGLWLKPIDWEHVAAQQLRTPTPAAIVFAYGDKQIAEISAGAPRAGREVPGMQRGADGPTQCSNGRRATCAGDRGEHWLVGKHTGGRELAEAPSRQLSSVDGSFALHHRAARACYASAASGMGH